MSNDWNLSITMPLKEILSIIKLLILHVEKSTLFKFVLPKGKNNSLCIYKIGPLAARRYLMSSTLRGANLVTQWGSYERNSCPNFIYTQAVFVVFRKTNI